MMNNQGIRVVLATEALLPEVVELLMAQYLRLQAQDPHLPRVHTLTQLQVDLLNHQTEDALVALDAQGRVRGYAQPTVWTLKDNTLLHAFLSPHNGCVHHLALPQPAEADALPVADALLHALDQFWLEAATSGDLLRWPESDDWLFPLLVARGFELDSICAIRPCEPFFSARPTPPRQQQIRAAQPADHERLVALFHEELRFHEQYTPFVRSSPEVLHLFGRKLERIWAGGSIEAGDPLVLVVEHEATIVAMIENSLLPISSLSDGFGFTPLGRYWCIDNMCVHAPFRGQGIGRLLLQGVEDVRSLLQLPVDGYVLWYNPPNPVAAHFWSGRGFHPLWRTYQRRHAIAQ